MIALLNGKLVSKTPDALIVDVSGVGYQINVTLSTYEQLPEEGADVSLNIFTYVREDTLCLYGFLTQDEKTLFIRLLKVNGIGPKLAISILSGVGPGDFVNAVVGEDLARLNAIPGVGKKTAERIIIDLKDKLAGITQTTITTRPAASRIFDDALSALLNLGYKKLEAEKVLGKVGVTKDAKLGGVIKDALKELNSL